MADPLPPPSIGGESIDWAERGLDSALPIGSAEPSGIGTLEEEAPVFGAGSVSGGRGRGRIGDRVFAALASGSGLFIVLLILLVAIFLVARAIPAIADDQVNFLFSREWSVEGATLRFGVLDLLWVTVVISLLAMLIAVPIAIGIALFITQYAPRRLARPVAYVVDLLAAIPSIIYGIWGITVLAPKLAPVQRALYHIPGPLFQDKNVEQGTIFNGGLVLAIMILPIITAISRDVFDRTPRQNVEAAWALGCDPVGDDPLGGPALRPTGRHRRLDARSGSGTRRDDRDHPDPVQVGRRIAVHVLNLQRRRDIRLQDREQRGRVQQPHADRGVHRGRPGPVRSHVRGQRGRPRRRHPAQGVRMSVTSLAPGQNHRLRHREEQPCHGPGHVVLRASR